MENSVWENRVEALLQSKQRLERDKGIVELKVRLAKEDTEKVSVDLVDRFFNQLSSINDFTPWEVTHGCLLGVKLVVQKYAGAGVKNGFITEEKVESLRLIAIGCLQHPEVRVRGQAGEFLGSLCSLRGSDIYKLSSVALLRLLEEDIERHMNDTDSLSSFSSSPGSDAGSIFHESAGWRHLETTMKCLQSMVEGCGRGFVPFITQNLLDLLFSALGHTNRFVRETGFNVFAAIVHCSQTETDSNNTLQKYGSQFCKHLSKGLSDNWSQVRLASSVATRNFLTSIEDKTKYKEYFPDLLPRLCLNRYYIADGVRIYTQETWAIISGGHGKDLVEDNIEHVVSYYVSSTKAENHAVREAACACISELAVKIRQEAVKKFVPELLAALLECFKDDSWPVRDAACIACGNFVLSYPDESLPIQSSLYDLFWGNLQDPIASVRQGAALALAKFVKAYGDSVLSKVVEDLKLGLQGISKQAESSENFSGLDKKPAQFGVVKNLHTGSDRDKKHTDQVMYSCGSLAPKMGRGSRGGCSDCHFQRPSEPWERSDGCLYFITELASDFADVSTKLIPDIVKALSYKHFPQHIVFVETLCRQLPVLASRIGKKPFKQHIEIFLDSIFYAASSDVQLTSAAGEECLIKLSKFIGANILRGRVENHNSHFLSQYDRIMCANPVQAYTGFPSTFPKP
uniref:uncharacterized protein LOC113475084 n=1 Tax=Ciona intestinalis TaxID=7719 RepID=UPI000180BE23|nr:uncharacterized protein LOC113475084 [Ciona intestinalis]|eukprot:XP_026694367.1 uncharacterized protein LOC113475084 [Ciona intestinalis]